MIILHNDCLRILKYFPDNVIDAVITDPPYNISKEHKFTMKGQKLVSNTEAWGKEFQDDYSYDSFIELMKILAYEFTRIVKPNHPIIIFYDRGKPQYLLPFYKKCRFMNIITFVKNNPVPHFRKKNYRSATEMAMWFCNGEKPEVFNFRGQEVMKNMYDGNIGQKDTDHPTEKYKWMIRPLVLNHTNKHGLVLDPFAGSGTTGIVCEQEERRSILIEKKETYCNIIRERYKNLRSNTKKEGSVLAI